MKDKMPQTVELDVRPYLRKKLEPFQVIMEAVKGLHKEDTFVLHATFKPTPLLGLMRTKGYVNKVEHVGDDHWTVTFVHKSRKRELGEDAETTVVGRNAAPSETTVSENNAAGENNVVGGNNTDPSPQTYELDNRGLEPPQPMIRTLNKLEKARPGDQVIIHNDRVPMFLIEELNTLGYKYTVDEQPDGSARVFIHKL